MDQDIFFKDNYYEIFNLLVSIKQRGNSLPRLGGAACSYVCYSDSTYFRTRTQDGENIENFFFFFFEQVKKTQGIIIYFLHEIPRISDTRKLASDSKSSHLTNRCNADTSFFQTALLSLSCIKIMWTPNSH